MFEITHRMIRFVPAMAGMLFLLVPAARASDISAVNAFWNIGYQQTGNGNTLTGSGDFFSTDLNTGSATNAYTSVTLSYFPAQK